jgi:TldD protein
MDINADKLFFTERGISFETAQSIVADALYGMDDGELYLEYCSSENLTFDDGKLKSATANTSMGYGLRSVIGETSAYAYSSILSEQNLKKSAEVVRAIRSGYAGDSVLADSPIGTNTRLYDDLNPINEMEFTAKIKLLEDIDSYLRSKDSRVRQVTASISAEWQVICIIKADGRKVEDIRPLVRVNVFTMVEENGRMEKGSSGAGGRAAYADFVTPHSWKEQADEALRQALANLESRPAPAGEMPVVLGNGWPGVMLHEAVGHGLEGDFNRKKTSAFAGLLGTRVAAPGVTVIDDGTIANRRGSLSVDDEGTASQKTVLIEDGILKGYMQDRLNARLMGVSPTGNSRRESYAHQPMPRMTNTYMLGGEGKPEDIIKMVKRGIYAPHFGGGQVDITSGKFVFSATEAYMIEDGQITYPIKGATIIGNGPDALTKIKAIGNDMQLDKGVGTCGKAGQSVPVGVGQPTLLIDSLTVGGTGS